MLARYKEGLDVDKVHSGIVTAVRDVINYALKLENSSGSGKDEIFTESKRFFSLKIDLIRAVQWRPTLERVVHKIRAEAQRI